MAYLDKDGLSYLVQKISQNYASKDESNEIKLALLNCFENVAWINNNGQTYYNALASALGVAPVNLFNAANDPEVNLYINQSSMQYKYTNSTTYRMTYIAVTAGQTYKITKIVSNSFRIGTSAAVPAYDGAILSTDANHSGTEMTITIPQGANYLAIVYGYNITEETNTSIRQSMSIVQL